MQKYAYMLINTTSNVTNNIVAVFNTREEALNYVITFKTLADTRNEFDYVYEWMHDNNLLLQSFSIAFSHEDDLTSVSAQNVSV